MTTFRSGASSIVCSLVPEDSRTFGFPVAAITALDLDETDGLDAPFRDLDGWCREERVRLVSCRLDHLRLRESMELERHGFRFVETVYRPRLADPGRGSSSRTSRSRSGRRPADDLPAVEAMAHDAFTTGRFLLDARLDPELSRRRYANWVRTSFGNPSHQVLVGELDGRPVGFFVVEREADDRVYWHLTAVAPDAQGRGVGLSLWRTMLLRHRSEGVGVVETTVSGHNPAVMNLYARLGFSFTAPQMTLHWLREPA